MNSSRCLIVRTKLTKVYTHEYMGLTKTMFYLKLVKVTSGAQPRTNIKPQLTLTVKQQCSIISYTIALESCTHT